MPQNQQHRKTFNLIKNDVEINEYVKYEKDWYMLLNLLVISLVVALSFLAFMYKLNLKSNVNAKAEELAQKINKNLNNDSKAGIRSKIVTLEEKYKVYNDFQNQNFDVNKFYQEVTALNPNVRLKVNQFTVVPDSNLIELSLTIEKEGYTTLPELLNSFEKSNRFKVFKLKNVTYATHNTDSSGKQDTLSDGLKKSDNFITSVALIVEKVSTSTDNTETQ